MNNVRKKESDNTTLLPTHEGAQPGVSMAWVRVMEGLQKEEEQKEKGRKEGAGEGTGDGGGRSLHR